VALYDSIGSNYDVTRKADPYITSRLIHHLNPEIGSRYLDIACGSGNYTIALKQAGLDICGLDISECMLNLASKKDPSIKWIWGNVEKLSFADSYFAGITCILSIHHFVNLKSVFKEVAHILKDNGAFVIFTALPEQMKNYWLNEYFPEAMEKSIAQMPGKNSVIEALAESGFKEIHWEPYEIMNDLQDFFLYIGKNRPEMYLNATNRQGSSTFSSLADAAEVEKGCELLDRDIRSGRINKVIESYSRTDPGDYMIIIAKKAASSTPTSSRHQ
jgi:ubiquinone/menaquinone biosynthesis C-methylase UbiE